MVELTVKLVVGPSRDGVLGVIELSGMDNLTDQAVQKAFCKMGRDFICQQILIALIAIALKLKNPPNVSI